MDTLDITFIDVGESFLIAKMPVTETVHQPDGILHGGATMALAETVGSVAAYIFTKAKKDAIRGIEFSANHLKSIKQGFVFAKVTPIHLGRTLQVWQIKVTNEKQELISLCKLSTIRLNK